MGRTMKRMLVVVFTLTALTGCATKPSTPTPTYLRGNWKIQITPAQGFNLTSATIQAGLVPVQVPCTLAVSVNNVTPPTVLGPTCIGANGYTGVGSISGTGMVPPQNGDAGGTPQSILLGVPYDPNTDKAPVALVYVEWYGAPNTEGSVIILQGTGTAGNGSMSGTFTGYYNCGSSASPCTGTFTGNQD